MAKAPFPPDRPFGSAAESESGPEATADEEPPKAQAPPQEAPAALTPDWE